MRIIRNLLILCALMCGLLFAARQFSAGMGKGDVLAYIACSGVPVAPCTPEILDMRTMVVLGFKLQNVYEVFWTENGDLYTIAGGQFQGLYRWGGKIPIEVGDSISYMYPARNENNRLAFIMNINGTYHYRYWNGVQWTEPIPPVADPYGMEWSVDGRFAFVSRDKTLYISDGVTMTNLGQASDYGVRWSVNGHLAFVSKRVATVKFMCGMARPSPM
jgi:hypothetical protein